MGSHFVLTEIMHFSTSMVGAFLGWQYYLTHTKKRHIHWVWFIVAGLSLGFFIDLDHLFDYWVAFPWTFSWHDFVRSVYVLKNDKMFLPLHAFEWTFLLFGSLFFIKKIPVRSIVLTIAVAMFLHILGDFYTNGLNNYGYFMTYRVANNFSFKAMVSPNHYAQDMEIKKRLFN